MMFAFPNGALVIVLTVFFPLTVILADDCTNKTELLITASSIAYWYSAGFEFVRSRVQSPVKDRVIPKTL